MGNADTNKASSPEIQSQKQAIAEIKNGRIIFKQKPHLLDKHSETLQELVKFRELILARLRSKLPMSELQDEYKPLVVKMAHESDKSLTSIAKHIHSHLLPIDDEEDEFDSATITQVFPVSIIEKAIHTTMNRNNYGIELDFTTTKIPNVLCIWRWEVKEPYKHYLPKTTLEKVASRIVERVHAKKELLASFNSLPEAERNALIPHRGTAAREAGKIEGLGSTMEQYSSTEPQGAGSGSSKQGPNNSEGTKVKPKKPENPEHLAKERKQNDAQKSLMANFFAKNKPGHSVAAGRKARSARDDISDFEKTFKPFVRKKDAEIAAVNSFLRRKQRRPTKANNVVIVLDFDDENLDAPGNYQSVSHSQLSVSERFYNALSALPESPLYRPPRSMGTSPSYKTYYSPSVRELTRQLSEAELTDDASAVRSITHQLADRETFPAKVLIFHEDNRPGYFGTWTRSSHVVGSRTPFAKDVLGIDYGYDSGEDWDEGDCAGSADDVLDDEDDEQDSEGQDSDMDDWLVDDEEVDQAGPPSSASDLDFPDVPLPNKRKAEEDKKASKKRKVVVPLVPYAKGPSWESVIGECKDSILGPYQIRFLNDASCSLNPFSFVSSTKVQQMDAIFAVPSLPNRAVADATNSVPPSTVVKKGASTAPKTSFPEDQLPVLLDRVNRLQSSNLTLIVETVFQELRGHKVKKNAIEAKIKEVGMKCRERKCWVIRDKGIGTTENTTAP